jgi:hypothetical protein
MGLSVPDLQPCAHARVIRLATHCRHPSLGTIIQLVAEWGCGQVKFVFSVGCPGQGVAAEVWLSTLPQEMGSAAADSCRATSDFQTNTLSSMRTSDADAKVDIV